MIKHQRALLSKVTRLIFVREKIASLCWCVTWPSTFLVTVKWLLSLSKRHAKIWRGVRAFHEHREFKVISNPPLCLSIAHWITAMPLNLPRWRRYLTVEPVVLFYTFGLFMSLPVLTQYVYYRVSKFKGFPYNISDTSEKGCIDDGGNSSIKELEKEVRAVTVTQHFSTK